MSLNKPPWNGWSPWATNRPTVRTDISPDGDPARQERASYGDVVLAGRLRAALERLNPDLSGEVLDEAVRKVTRADSPSLIDNNTIGRVFSIDKVASGASCRPEHSGTARQMGI